MDPSDPPDRRPDRLSQLHPEPRGHRLTDQARWNPRDPNTNRESGEQRHIPDPQILSLPGGWSSISDTEPITIEQGSTSIWELAIQGNGVAAGGLAKVRFLTQDGSAFLWNRTIEVTSGAAPVVSFQSIVLADGSTSPSPLGLGPLPIATQFDLSWSVSNQGLGTWSPSAELTSQGEGWTTNCTPVSPVQPSTSSLVWCSVTIPESQEGNVEVPLTLRLESEGLLAIDTVSILVQVTSKVSWTMRGTAPILASGDSTVVTLDAVNLGNTQINTKIAVETPSDWIHQVTGSEILSLSPGESRSVEVYLSVGDSRGLSRLTYKEGHPSRGQPSRYHSKYARAPSTPGPTSHPIGGWVGGRGIVLVIVITQLRKGRESGTEAHYEEEIQCFLCDMPVVDGGAYACGECGARFHSPGQSKSCDLTQMESCTNCGASRELLVRV